MRWLRTIGVILLFIYLAVALPISAFVGLFGGAMTGFIVGFSWPVTLLPRWLGF